MPFGPPYDISRPKGRARLSLAVFNLHKLLSAVNVKLPKLVLPVGKDIVCSHVGFSSYIHFRSDNAAVQKNVHPWSGFETVCHTQLRWLEEMYAATAGSAGLVHLVPASLKHDLVRDRLSMQLQPRSQKWRCPAKLRGRGLLRSPWLPAWLAGVASGG